MTESAFWGMIRSALRAKSRWWKPTLIALEKAKRKSLSENKRLKWEYKCAKCKKWFKRASVQVDHIVPAGTLKSAHDLPLFVEKLFCEAEGLQVLCCECHKTKTNEERNGE
jgi:5-methylcytosine-specific restriction endonuclease McrA